MDFAAIERRRQAMKLTQKALCLRAGVNQVTYSQLKTGQRDGKASTYRKLVDALDALVAEKAAQAAE